ncbi:hypothetical protein LRP67_17835 [Nocardioides sp. cx-169]|uniref:hypothetical protein n=1 Tax=Nocardioides sp. cx-169 TaxID=2899080 RepID=UPI001E4B30BA|nr:hypothetical protein [Nocardioides sp. cx-169]MCD4535953.1 hypothetical protein [Nocardioides sp. cx-169]
MTAEEPALAGDVYAHVLETLRRGRLRRAAILAVDVVASVLSAPSELSSAGDVVVRRRADGVEVLRVPVGPPEEAAQISAHVEQQLAGMSPAEFRATWGIA